jgi:hypothetical protein
MEGQPGVVAVPVHGSTDTRGEHLQLIGSLPGELSACQVNFTAYAPDVSPSRLAGVYTVGGALCRVHPAPDGGWFEISQ